MRARSLIFLKIKAWLLVGLMDAQDSMLLARFLQFMMPVNHTINKCPRKWMEME